MKRFLKEMIGIMGLTILISSQSPAFAAENALSKVRYKTYKWLRNVTR